MSVYKELEGYIQIIADVFERLTTITFKTLTTIQPPPEFIYHAHFITLHTLLFCA